MGPRLVQVPNQRPQRCAFLPTVGASNEPTGFWDFGTELDREHAYLSHTAFRLVARKADYIPAAGARQQIASLRALLEEAQRGRAEAEETLRAVGTLKARGFETARPPGRQKGPAKKKAAVPA